MPTIFMCSPPRVSSDGERNVSCHTMPLGYLHGAPRTGKNAAPPQPFSRAELLVIAACAISMLIVQMDWFALNLAIPAIARQFHVPPTDLQWVISGYMLSIGALMVTAGRSGRFPGARRGGAVGAVRGAPAIGRPLGPFVGATFSESLGGRGVFSVNIPLCVAAIALMPRYVRDSRHEPADRHIDVVGML